MSDYAHLSWQVAKLAYQHPDILYGDHWFGWPLYNQFILQRERMPKRLRGSIDIYGDNTGYTQEEIEAADPEFYYIPNTQNTEATMTSRISARSNDHLAGYKAQYIGSKRIIKRPNPKSKRRKAPWNSLLKSMFPVLKWKRKGFQNAQITDITGNAQGVHCIYSANASPATYLTVNNSNLDVQMAQMWTKTDLEIIANKVFKDVSNVQQRQTDSASLPGVSNETKLHYNGLECLGGYRRWTFQNVGASIATIICYILTYKRDTSTDPAGPAYEWTLDVPGDDIIGDTTTPQISAFQHYQQNLNTPGQIPDAKKNKNFNRKYTVYQKEVLTLAPGQHKSFTMWYPKTTISQERLKAYTTTANNGTYNSPQMLKGLTRQLMIITRGQLVYDDTNASNCAMGPGPVYLECMVHEEVSYRGSFLGKRYMEIMTQLDPTTAPIDQATENASLFPTLTTGKIINPHGEGIVETTITGTDYD